MSAADARRRICLVTDELHPFTGGGIGRVLHNLIQHALALAPELEVHVLLPESTGIEVGRVEAVLGPRVHGHAAPTRRADESTRDGGALYPPRAAFAYCDWHAESMDLMLALRGLAARGLRFEVIEFPDYKGWAHCTLQEKRLGLAFADARIGVRLHSTDGILQRFEPREPSLEQSARRELERKALRDADVIVAHLPAVAELDRDHYGFDAAWARRVRVEFPPVVLEPPAPRAPVQGQRDLLFATKLQQVKRPDLFVRGAVQFMRETPLYRGIAVLACREAVPGDADRLRRMIPRDLSERFRFAPPGPERDERLGRSILVVPSAHESCGLTAYEGAAAGAVVVLNGRCAAFEVGSPFVDGVNCHVFDGTVEGLARGLARAWSSPPPEAVTWRAARPYWLDDPPRAPAPVRRGTSSPRVSVIVTNYNLARYLPAALDSVAESSWPRREVVLVDDASTEPLDDEVLTGLERSGNHRGVPVRVIRNPVNRGLPGARNVGARAATGAYILPLDADDAISARFMDLAAQALESSTEHDVVVPCAGYFRTDEERAAERFIAHQVFLGETPSLGLVVNRMSCATALFRTQLLQRFPYDETLDSYEDWDLLLRLSLAGCRFLVTNAIEFHYRSRPNSMIFGMTRERHFALLSRMLEKVSVGVPGLRLSPLVAQAAVPAIRLDELGIEQGQAFPLRYRLADAANRSLMRVPFVQPALKRAISAWARARAPRGAP